MILFSAICALLLPTSLKAEKELPFPQVEGWELKVYEEFYTSENLWHRINGAADAFLKYDFKDLHLADYTKGNEIITVYLYRHSSLPNTFGIYTQERYPDYDFLEIGGQGYQSSGILNFFKGNYYIKLSSSIYGDESAPGLQALAAEIAAEIETENVLPPELNLFPQENRVEYSDMYISENFMGYGFLAEAFTIDYLLAEKKCKAFIIHQQDAAKIESMLQSYLKIAKKDDWNDDMDFNTIHDPFNGTIYLSRKGNYLLGLANGTEEQAKEIILQIKQSL